MAFISIFVDQKRNTFLLILLKWVVEQDRKNGVFLDSLGIILSFTGKFSTLQANGRDREHFEACIGRRKEMVKEGEREQ